MSFPGSLKELLSQPSEKRNCKTKSSFNGPNKKINNNFKNFDDYMINNKNLYFKEFKEKFYSKEDKDLSIKSNNLEQIDAFKLLEIQKAFDKEMPYISGRKKISNNSIQFPKKQFIMKQLFQDIIKIINNKNKFPLNKEYGLAYFEKQEWIFFTIDEVNYQNYISDSKKIMSLFYKDYMDNKIEINSLFSEDDKFILPSNVRGYNFETNVFKYFCLKTNLPTAPELLIKLKKENLKNDAFDKDDNTTNNQNLNKKIYFNDYIDEIKSNFNYLELDGALINSKNEEIEIKEIENEILTYQSLNVISSNKENINNYKCEIDKLNASIKSIKIPPKTVIFFQTKLEGPYINLDIKSIKENSDLMDKIKDKKYIKKELIIVLCKMILYNKYFYDLYQRIGIIDKKFYTIFFLVFDNYPLIDISEVIKDYIDILIEKNLVKYQFTIQPIYMNTCIEKNNSTITINYIKKEIEEMKKNDKKNEDLFEELKEMRNRQRTKPVILDLDSL